MTDFDVSERAGTVRFTVRVQPRASRSEIVGLHDGALKVRLTAPPVDSAANEALIDLLARRLNVPRSAVRITAGLGSRIKSVEVAGVARNVIEHLASGPRAE